MSGKKIENSHMHVKIVSLKDALYKKETHSTAKHYIELLW